MRVSSSISFLFQTASKIMQYALTKPFHLLTVILYAQAKYTEASVKVSYLAYPLNFSSTWLLSEYADSHIPTAVLHMVHTGLLFELDNREYYELHYGQNKWDNNIEDQNQVYEYSNSHYPHFWQGDCDPDIRSDITEENAQIKLAEWADQSQVGKILFNYYADQLIWKGHLITINGDNKILTNISIDPDSNIHNKLDQIDYWQKVDPKKVEKLTLTNYMRRQHIFGNSTPFCWKGNYEIGFLPEGMTYLNASTTIFQYWHNTTYVFGIHDCWEMIFWFSKEYLHVPPEKLKGPLGAYLSSPGHVLRVLARILRPIPLAKTIIMISSTVVAYHQISRRLFLRPYRNIFLIFSAFLILNFILPIENLTANRITDPVGNVFALWVKEINTFLNSLSETSFSFLLPPLFMATSSLPYVFLCSLVINIYKISGVRNNKNPLDDEIDDFLSWLAIQTSGPKKYNGRLLGREKKSDTTFLNYQQVVAQIPANYLKYSAHNKEIRYSDDQGEFFAIEFLPNKDSSPPFHHIAFYIPGTASSLNNQAISDMTASHLAHALDMPVICIGHRLTPSHKWPIPLYDTYKIILDFYQRYNHPKLVLSGYSSGGLLATLAALSLIGKKNIKIERLILFAPLLDASGEFGYKENQENKESYLKYISSELNISYSDYQKIYADSQIDNFFREDQYFKDMIVNCFPRSYLKNPISLRGSSPAWMTIAALRSLPHFPKTLIMTGQYDCFKMDSILFYQKLAASGKQVLLLLLSNTKHDVMWQNLYPVYLSHLAQSITKAQKIIFLDEKISAADQAFKKFCEDSKGQTQKKRPGDEKELEKMTEHVSSLKKQCHLIQKSDLWRRQISVSEQEDSTQNLINPM